MRQQPERPDFWQAMEQETRQMWEEEQELRKADPDYEKWSKEIDSGTVGTD
jgi:hypothetical protein